MAPASSVFSGDELRAAVSKFYEESINRQTPMVICYLAFQAQGTDQVARQKLVETMRRSSQ